jgi:hypothetical protein
MRTFSSTVENILLSGNIDFFFLIKLSFNSNYYITSYSNDIVYNGDTYSANGGLFEVDSPKFSSVVDREAYRVLVLDNLNAMKTEIEANVVGKPIEVKLGFVDSNGNPITTPSDVLSIYKGYVDNPVISNDWEHKVITFEGTSALADLDMINSYITSRDGMDQKSLKDTSFDQIYENSAIEVKWGKIDQSNKVESS